VQEGALIFISVLTSYETAIHLAEKLLKSRDLRSELQRDRYSILNDDYDAFLDNELRKRFDVVTRAYSEIRRYLDKSANVYKYICGLLSVVYLEPPQRSFVLPADNEVYRQAVDVADFDVAMEQVNLLTTACNECFVRPVMRGGIVDIDIIPPHRVEVAHDGPRLLGIIYPILLNGENLFSYWDDQWNYIFDGNSNIVTRREHFYGEVPFVVYRRARPVDGFWLGRSGQDLVDLFVDQTIQRSWINRVGYLQSYQQVYQEEEDAIGDAIGMTQQHPTFGPDSIPRGKFRTLDLRTDVTRQLQVAESKLQRAAANWHISSDALNQTTHTSGIARLLSYSSLLECRRRSIKHYRPADIKLMRLQAKVWNIDGAGSKFSPDPSPKINYAEPELVATQIDRISILDKEIVHGVRSPVDYVMRNDPDLASRDEAMGVIRRNLDENRIVQENRQSFQTPANLDLERKITEGMMGGRPENDRLNSFI
jgi:hypothetical protein